MPIVPSAEPFYAAGNATGVLVLHGFTGAPASVRPWGEHLAGAGFTVAVPRLPGHGTSWQELNKTTWTDWYAEASRALDRLAAECDEVFVCGLSMGGCLALRLAEERGDDVAGLVLVNPSVIDKNRALVAVPLLKRIVGSVKGITDDIKKPGAIEYGYDRLPLRALDSLRALWKATRDDLASVTAPLLVFRSADDHVVAPLSTQTVMQGVSSPDAIERVLHDSYHVATLDYDAEAIFAGTAEFVRAHSGRSADLGAER
ncbi:MAG TPA: alpha/beta fold hydrolase [Nocardioidaceae bacterium]|nr:alpha/beta fold hydrolase [Nocardioidaceae bacterium]